VRKLKKSFSKRITGFPLILGFITVLLIPSSASASISNGTFEFETGTSITGWTAINKRIDLGGELLDAGTSEDVVSTIAGCATVDTSNYSNLRGWVAGDGSPGSGDVPDDPVGNNDSIELLANYGSLPTFTTKAVDGSDGNEVDASYQRSGNILRLESSVGTNSIGGYVLHGPAVYSDPFTAQSIDDLTIDWAADSNGDDYHVFGYLLNTATCAQTEVVDSNGRSSDWQTSDVAVPSDGTYRFVFVAGTFDQSFGTVAGGTMYIDNILLTVNEARAAEAAAAAGGFTPKPALPEMESYQIGADETGNPQLRIEGKRIWCVYSMTIDGVEVPIETGYSTPWYEYLNADITGISPGQKTLVAQSCYGQITYENWVTITPVVAPKSTWFKAQSFGLDESMRMKIAEFNSSLGNGYNKVRCIVNSSNGTDLNEAFAKQICALAQSNDLSHAEVVIQERTTFSGRGYWVNIWASGGYN
jgi:hypothetical protein